MTKCNALSEVTRCAQMTPERCGEKRIRGRLMSPGGLYGMYFENSDFTDHSVAPDGSLATNSYERIDSAVDFLWDLGTRPVGDPETIGKDIGPDFFSVRWRGLVKPQASQVLLKLVPEWQSS